MYEYNSVMKWRKSAESGAKVGQQCCEILECASEEALSAYARLRVCVCKAGVQECLRVVRGGV